MRMNNDRHDLELRPLTQEQAAALRSGVPPHLVGTTPPPVPERPHTETAELCGQLNGLRDQLSRRHREDQAWIAKVTEGMRKDLKQLYEGRTNFVRREMGERLEASAQARRNAEHRARVKDIELKRALETVGRQQIELEGLREQLDQQLRKEHR